MAVYHFIEFLPFAWSLDSVVSKYEEKQGFYSVVSLVFRLLRSRCFLEYSTRFFILSLLIAIKIMFTLKQY